MVNWFVGYLEDIDYSFKIIICKLYFIKINIKYIW